MPQIQPVQDKVALVTPHTSDSLFLGINASYHYLVRYI